MTSPKVRMVPYNDLGEVTFRPGEPVVGIYQLASADSQAHILLLAPSEAWVLAQTLLAESPGVAPAEALPDLDDMARSALGELGSIVGGFFLSFILGFFEFPLYYDLLSHSVLGKHDLAIIDLHHDGIVGAGIFQEDPAPLHLAYLGDLPFDSNLLAKVLFRIGQKRLYRSGSRDLNALPELLMARQ